MTSLVAQDLKVQGVVVNRDTRQPVSYAHISLCGEALGTVTNEAGSFVFNVPMEYAADTLCVSFIGYETYRATLSGFLNGALVEIDLVPKVHSLSEITISDRAEISPEKLVQKAIQRIPKNYSWEPYLMEGYYRDYLEDEYGETYHHLLEAAIAIYDEGFARQDIHNRIKVYQTRQSHGAPLRYEEHYENNLGGRSGHINIIGGNELSILMYNNPVRNYNRGLRYLYGL
ncbi:MAG: carboxypeptidase-like regulatory domain-containing protein [Bacteroidia bacterium]|nr:carboxypeptidase-like regulatory domain-containing protein [Bacteroidia bacterium]